LHCNIRSNGILEKIAMTPLPHNKKVCTGRMLAEILDKLHLSKSEAKAWRRDLRMARKGLKAPIDKWRNSPASS
jgi:hypothetical protein